MPRLPEDVRRDRTVVGSDGYLAPSYLATRELRCVGCQRVIPAGERFTVPTPSGRSPNDLIWMASARLAPHCDHCAPFTLP